MTKLIFKDVGHGDSIILRKENKESTSYFIIDCCLKDDKNPVLEEIKNCENKVIIELLFISHGHLDHYSGANALIKYCEKQNIQIEIFSSTLLAATHKFYRNTLGRNENIALTKFLKNVYALHQKNIIQELFPPYAIQFSCQIDSNYTLTGLHPTLKYYEKFTESMDDYLSGTRESKPNLHSISTILKIQNKERIVLLTSDATKTALKLIYHKYILGKDMILNLTQSSHHGSKNNHSTIFNKIKRIDKCPVVFSCGYSQHKIPNKEVVDSFIGDDYKIFATNAVYGIVDAIQGSEETEEILKMIDLGFPLVEESKGQDLSGQHELNGDKFFDLKESEIAYIPQH